MSQQAQPPTYGAPGPVPRKKSRVWLWIVLGVVALVFIAIIASCAALMKGLGTALSEPGISSTASGSPGSARESGGPVDTTAKIGSVVTYEDGTTISVTKVEMKDAKKYEEAASDGRYLVVSVKITNGQDKNFNADLSSVDVSYGRDGNQAERAYINGLAEFSGEIAPGKSRTAQYGFKVTKKQAADLQVSVEPGWLDYPTAIFTGGV
jgi:hypothetical protein